MSQIIRAIPQWAGPSEVFYDVSSLTWKQRKEFEAELGQQNNYVQTIMLADPMPIMIGAQIRREMEEQKDADV